MASTLRGRAAQIPRPRGGCVKHAAWEATYFASSHDQCMRHPRSHSGFVSQHEHAHLGMRTGRVQGSGSPSARCVSEREHATAAPSLLASLSLTGQAWTALNRRTSGRAGSVPLSLETVLHLVSQAPCSGEHCTTNLTDKRSRRLSAVRRHRCYYSCCIRSHSRF